MMLSTSPEMAQSALFAPYCGGLARQQSLLQALRLLSSGQFIGKRKVEGASGHSFRLSWRAGTSPMEDSDCQLSFPDHPDISYRFVIPTHQLVDWLMESSEASKSSDLPDQFWGWLLLGQEIDGDEP